MASTQGAPPLLYPIEKSDSGYLASHQETSFGYPDAPSFSKRLLQGLIWKNVTDEDKRYPILPIISMTHHPDVQLYLIDYYSKGCIEGLNLKITL
jgi:hypothetical protein